MKLSAEYVICPYCSHEHGDAWEWCNSDRPQTFECDECKKSFRGWADYHVTYCTTVLDPPPEAKP